MLENRTHQKGGSKKKGVDGMNPAEIALKNMHLVLKIAAALFVFGIGLDIFGSTYLL